MRISKILVLIIIAIKIIILNYQFYDVCNNIIMFLLQCIMLLDNSLRYDLVLKNIEGKMIQLCFSMCFRLINYFLINNQTRHGIRSVCEHG